MTEKTAFDILFDKLHAKGMKPETQISAKTFIVPGKDRLLNTKYIIASNSSFFFCAYDSFGTSAYSSKTFTGIYSAINLPNEIECNIYKKEWTDFILRRRKQKTGINYIDQNFTITSSTNWTPAFLLNLTNVNQYLELINKISPLKIIIQYDYLPIVNELKGKTIIGIETNNWLYEDNDLDMFINFGGQLIKNMTNTCA
ncbi:MAG: hypothetical protein U0W24_08335 [Bacteroidales bacterium]